MSAGIDHLRQPLRRSLPRQTEPRSVVRFGLAPIAVYVVVVGLWVAFGALLLQGSGEVADLWERYRALPLGVEVAAGLLLLPWVLAVGIWQAEWPVALRLGLDGLLAVVTLVAFFPVGQVGETEREAPNRADEEQGAL
jgi:hypothetical protein